MREKKFRLEAASLSEAAFLFCNYNPFMKARIIKFRSHAEMDSYKSEARTIQIKPHLPILLELTEVDTDDEKLIQINFKRMANWYYYSVIKT